MAYVGLSDYEILRQKKIASNMAVMESMGLTAAVSSIAADREEDNAAADEKRRRLKKAAAARKKKKRNEPRATPSRKSSRVKVERDYTEKSEKDVFAPSSGDNVPSMGGGRSERPSKVRKKEGGSGRAKPPTRVYNS